MGCNVPCVYDDLFNEEEKAFITMYQGIDQVVFQDSLFQEIVFSLIESVDLCQTSLIERDAVCDFDTTMARPHIFNQDECNVKLRSASKNYEINISLTHVPKHLGCVTPERRNLQVLSVFTNLISDSLVTKKSLDHYILPYESWETVIVDSITLNGTVFTNVITSAWYSPFHQHIVSYYHGDLGLIGFRDVESGQLYSFVRFN